ncbi:hypothetical protein [Bacillus taeanensis]|uniref:Uncharacterized protein n=1 Tax=Bacillus taeanensis TaxID=273032 RepID=A0A366XX36_9BACI|nr:hypothetical protein [Bacillus taeanensis]RBW69715.1 hypothetical protein DS031_09255 [Bacillus taeanensis]
MKKWYSYSLMAILLMIGSIYFLTAGISKNSAIEIVKGNYGENIEIHDIQNKQGFYRVSVSDMSQCQHLVVQINGKNGLIMFADKTGNPCEESLEY